jgi:hypothetical protein
VAAPRRACSRPPRSGYSWRARCLRLYAFYATHFWSIQGQFQSHHFLDHVLQITVPKDRAHSNSARAGRAGPHASSPSKTLALPGSRSRPL